MNYIQSLNTQINSYINQISGYPKFLGSPFEKDDELTFKYTNNFPNINLQYIKEDKEN